jgi:eukaryotic-like serine/threonine-protein kinase
MSSKQNPSYPTSLSRKIPAIKEPPLPNLIPKKEEIFDDQDTSVGEVETAAEKTASSIELLPSTIRPEAVEVPETNTYPGSLPTVPPALHDEPTNIKPAPVSGVSSELALKKAYPVSSGLAAMSKPSSKSNATTNKPPSGAPVIASKPFELGVIPTDAMTEPLHQQSTGRSRRKRGIPSDVLPPDVKAALANFKLSKADPDRYELGEEFARGGLGRIRRAQDKHLDRPVAVKELILERGVNGHRFLREALITARLEHPSIVPVHDAGNWPSGGAFYTMKLVSGRSLDEVLDESKTLESRLTLLSNVIDVCDAIAYAHSKKIIHRDIKPANVLIGSFGETVVIDWGLAKDLRDSNQDDPLSEAPPIQMSQGQKAVAAGLTMDGAVIGTPAYMSPEQVNAKGVDERSDVYALGALLYHVLSGNPPFEGSNSFEILANVVLKPPKPLLSIYPNIPPDLIAIVEKAMAKNADARYPTAKELAQDLKRFQAGQLVGARSYSSLDLFKRFVRKYKLPLAITAASLMVLFVFGLLSLANIVTSRDQANTARASAETEKQRSEARANDLALLQAKNALSHDPTMAIAWLKLMSPESAGWDKARVIAADAHGIGVARQVLHSQKSAIIAAASTQDNKKIATASTDGTIHIWNPTTSTSFALEGHSAEVVSVAFSPDGNFVASASKDDSVRLWDISCEMPQQKTGCGPTPQIFQGRESPVSGAWFSSVAYAPNGMWLAASNTDGTVRVWSLPAGKERVFKGHTSDVNRVVFSPDTQRLASSGNDSAILLWDVASGTQRPLKGHSGAVYAIVFSPDGKRLASASEDKSIRLWDLETGYSSALNNHEDTINYIAFSHDGSMLASASDDKMIRLWNTSTKKSQLLSGHKDAAVMVQFSPNAKQLLSASRDGTIRLWEVDTLNGRSLNGHEGSVTYASFSNDGTLIFSAGDDGALRVWDTTKGFSSVQAGHTAYVNSVTFSPDGEFIASASVDHTVRLWSFKAHTGRVLIVHEDEVTQTVFSPDGSLVASASKDNTVRLFNVTTGKSTILPNEERAVNQITFSKDGRLIAAASDSKTIHYWEVATSTEHLLRGHRDTVRFVAFSPDGKFLASASEDKSIHIWDLSKDEAVAVLTGHQGFVNHVAFSPDGMLLASASSDQTVRLWDLTTQREKITLKGHKDNVLQVAFSPDGKRVASSGKDALVYLWNLNTNEGTPLSGHKNWVTQILFSADGNILASASRDNTMRLWELNNLAAAPKILAAHEKAVTYMTLSPDGKTLASASQDQSTILWEMSNPIYKDENLLYCHEVYLEKIDVPTTPTEILTWLDSITSAQIVDDQIVTK